MPGLSVAQNVFLGAEPRRFGFVRRRALGAEFARSAHETGFELPPESAGRRDCGRPTSRRSRSCGRSPGEHR